VYGAVGLDNPCRRMLRNREIEQGILVDPGQGGKAQRLSFGRVIGLKP